MTFKQAFQEKMHFEVKMGKIWKFTHEQTDKHPDSTEITTNQHMRMVTNMQHIRSKRTFRKVVC